MEEGMSSVASGEDCPEETTESRSRPFFTLWPPLSSWLHHLTFSSLPPPPPKPPRDIMVPLPVNFRLLEYALCFQVSSAGSLPSGGPTFLEHLQIQMPPAPLPCRLQPPAVAFIHLSHSIVVIYLACWCMCLDEKPLEGQTQALVSHIYIPSTSRTDRNLGTDPAVLVGAGGAVSAFFCRPRLGGDGAAEPCAPPSSCSAPWPCSGAAGSPTGSNQSPADSMGRSWAATWTQTSSPQAGKAAENVGWRREGASKEATALPAPVRAWGGPRVCARARCMLAPRPSHPVPCVPGGQTQRLFSPVGLGSPQPLLWTTAALPVCPSVGWSPGSLLAAGAGGLETGMGQRQPCVALLAFPSPSLAAPAQPQRLLCLNL
uniref:photoreceptor disk component PRCD isoform X2 n=1 Tax=Panthera onca TaxID=9690 RepID=UPI002954225F|nr:photoreceptor disk component PRCD isoform X2 [Panthera onca]